MKLKLRTALVSATIFALAFLGIRYANDLWKDHQKQTALNNVVTEILSYSGFDKSQEDMPALADDIREYINKHSRYDQQGEFLALWPDQRKVSQAFLDGIKGSRPDFGPMECSTRGNLMADMLHLKGYRTRNVVLYAPKKNLNNHRIIEVLNPQTGSWEAQDPMYDIYWARISDKKRAPISHVVDSPQTHIPCNNAKCGWDMITHENQKVEWLRDYLNVATIHDKNSGLRVSLYGPEFDPSAIYDQEKEGRKKGSFCDLYPKNCRQGLIAASTYKEK